MLCQPGVYVHWGSVALTLHKEKELLFSMARDDTLNLWEDVSPRAVTAPWCSHSHWPNACLKLTFQGFILSAAGLILDGVGSIWKLRVKWTVQKKEFSNGHILWSARSFPTQMILWVCNKRSPLAVPRTISLHWWRINNLSRFSPICYFLFHGLVFFVIEEWQIILLCSRHFGQGS